MSSVGIKELKQDASRILRRVREHGESFDVTYHGKVVARLVPANVPEAEPVTHEEFWAEWDALAREISRNWPEGLSAVDAVREGRREL
ncbi:hypothetical protein BH23CHL2_BH23CHL2_07550 [soil metagenome]